MVVVGNEILSGKVQDSNSYFAARELRKIGVALKRVAVVPDELKAIADEVAYCARTFDFVLTSGGVGPTHDDITIEAVAIAFGRKVVIHPELEVVIREHFTERTRDRDEDGGGSRRCGAERPGGNLRFPTVQLENVYVLPGIPQIFESKLTALVERFTTDPYFVHAIYTSAGEGTIAEHLNSCLQTYPELLLGSYPRIGDPEYRVKLTLESKDSVYLERAFKHLLELLPREVVVKIE